MLARPSLPACLSVKSNPCPLSATSTTSRRSRTEMRSQTFVASAWRTHVGQRFLEREKNLLPKLRVQRVLRQFLVDIQPARHPGQVEQPLRVRTKITGQRGDGVILRIDRPHNFVQRRHHAPGRLRQFVQIPLLLRGGRGGTFHEGALHFDLRQPRAKLIVVQIMGHAGALLLHLAMRRRSACCRSPGSALSNCRGPVPQPAGAARPPTQTPPARPGRARWTSREPWSKSTTAALSIIRRPPRRAQVNIERFARQTGMIPRPPFARVLSGRFPSRPRGFRWPVPQRDRLHFGRFDVSVENEIAVVQDQISFPSMLRAIQQLGRDPDQSAIVVALQHFIQSSMPPGRAAGLGGGNSF